MPAIIAMRYRRRIGACPCCVSLQRRTLGETSKRRMSALGQEAKSLSILSMSPIHRKRTCQHDWHVTFPNRLIDGLVDTVFYIVIFRLARCALCRQILGPGPFVLLAPPRSTARAPR